MKLTIFINIWCETVSEDLEAGDIFKFKINLD